MVHTICSGEQFLDWKSERQKYWKIVNFWHHALIIKNRCASYQIESEPVQNQIWTLFFFNLLEFQLQRLPEHREYWKTVVELHFHKKCDFSDRRSGSTSVPRSGQGPFFRTPLRWFFCILCVYMWLAWFSIRCVSKIVSSALTWIYRSFLIIKLCTVGVCCCLFFICSTSLPGGNQVDGLPPVSSLLMSGQIWKNEHRFRIFSKSDHSMNF